MIKISKIGNIELDNNLFLLETFSIKNVKAEKFNTLDGGSIIFESTKRNNANDVTLDSKESGWLKESTLNEILTIANGLGVTVTLYAKDGATMEARFRIEENDAITAEQVYEGSEWYKVVLKMARI